MLQERLFVLTGAPGSGKSTLLQHLRTLGFPGVAEPARQILSEQRRIGGNGIPSRSAPLFVDLMLSRAMHEYHRLSSSTTPVFFDRGIPDTVGYALQFGFESIPCQNAAREYRYNNLVFFTPDWEQIYAPDEERTMSFQAACQFGANLRDIYQQLGYTLVDIPCLSVEARAEFILNSI